MRIKKLLKHNFGNSIFFYFKAAYLEAYSDISRIAINELYRRHIDEAYREYKGHIRYMRIIDPAIKLMSFDKFEKKMIEKSSTRLICKKCNGIAKPSKAYGDALGKPNQAGSRRILEGRGGLIDCWKCKKCGHSWA